MDDDVSDDGNVRYKPFDHPKQQPDRLNNLNHFLFHEQLGLRLLLFLTSILFRTQKFFVLICFQERALFMDGISWKSIKDTHMT